MLDNVGREQIDGSESVLLAILIKDTPGTTFGHALDGWEIVIVGDIGVVGHVVDVSFPAAVRVGDV